MASDHVMWTHKSPASCFSASVSLSPVALSAFSLQSVTYLRCHIIPEHEHVMLPYLLSMMHYSVLLTQWHASPRALFFFLKVIPGRLIVDSALLGRSDYGINMLIYLRRTLLKSFMTLACKESFTHQRWEVNWFMNLLYWCINYYSYLWPTWIHLYKEKL